MAWSDRVVKKKLQKQFTTLMAQVFLQGCSENHYLVILSRTFPSGNTWYKMGTLQTTYQHQLEYQIPILQ